MHYFSSLTQTVMWCIVITLRPSSSTVFILQIQHSSGPTSQPKFLDFIHAFFKAIWHSSIGFRDEKNINESQKRPEPKMSCLFWFNFYNRSWSFCFNLNKESCLLVHVFRNAWPSLDDDQGRSSLYAKTQLRTHKKIS